jgi:hypothetical protein
MSVSDGRVLPVAANPVLPGISHSRDQMGLDIRRERQDLLPTQTFNPRGRFQFTAGPTSLNGFAAAMELVIW